MHPLQGGLKTLPREKYKKLKKSILRHGISFPFFTWKHGGKLYILDGHQRDKALLRLQRIGYKIPALAIDFIEAKNETEAKEKILLLSSQYGEMTEESLLEYIKGADLDLEDLEETVDLPTLNLEKISERIGAELEEEEEKKPELEYQYQVIVECKDEAEQLKLVEKLEKEKYTCRALIL